ncbi:Mitochondrial presequence protease, partial [Coemansia sp. S142-1]
MQGAIKGARILAAAAATSRTARPVFGRASRAAYTTSLISHTSAGKQLLKPRRQLSTTAPAGQHAHGVAATTATSSEPSASSLVTGQEVHGFVVEDVQIVSELKLKAIRLRHQKTGAEWLHIDRDDSNNVFSVGFNTSVSDSTGVPHILEHTTLCGSSKYPVRDPFFKMLNRSMSTFMNAWTAHDYT